MQEPLQEGAVWVLELVMLEVDPDQCRVSVNQGVT